MKVLLHSYTTIAGWGVLPNCTLKGFSQGAAKSQGSQGISQFLQSYASIRLLNPKPCTRNLYLRNTPPKEAASLHDPKDVLQILELGNALGLYVDNGQENGNYSLRGIYGCSIWIIEKKMENARLSSGIH